MIHTVAGMLNLWDARSFSTSESESEGRVASAAYNVALRAIQERRDGHVTRLGVSVAYWFKDWRSGLGDDRLRVLNSNKCWFVKYDVVYLQTIQSD